MDIQESADGYVRQVDGYLVLEAGLPPTSPELESAYRSFAVTCVEKKVRRALVKIGDGSAVGERALRDAFTMLMLEGSGFGFRIALVAATSEIRARYSNAQRDLSLAGVDARLFDSEAEAVWWLANPGARTGAPAAR